MMLKSWGSVEVGSVYIIINNLISLNQFVVIGLWEFEG
jgi:hypothetical protein